MTESDYARKERFIKDPISRRLGNLAVNLNRVGVFAEKNSAESVRNLIGESVRFIEWSAADTAPEVSETLVQFQVQLARWQLTWNDCWNDQAQQQKIISATKTMSEQVLNMI